MYDLVLEWLGVDSSFVSHDLFYAAVCIASFLILIFLLDFLRFIMYYISRR